MADSLNDNCIETRLSDGLKEIGKEEGDTLVIAGMGGPLMEKILTEGEETRKGFRELILQPQSDIPHVRKFLFENMVPNSISVLKIKTIKGCFSFLATLK